ncbi:MAG TPA: RagB/SusD family nutrient uptake outer membrane protein [Ohtaekwangia sp.]|uniref:RagB/SusD family nutrient uptake outer membrane protein n=1 Tax=Ohtaekwangia sp. TaxID=2066019 RepID=UPI002F95435B
MKTIIRILFITSFVAIVGCTDLDVAPESSATADLVFTEPAAYKQFLAKIYAGLAISGQQGPAGDPDITGIDEGFSTYLRQYWKAQELTTDEAVIAWNDGTLPTYHLHTWTAQNEFVNAMFNRIYFQISMANEFLRQTTDDKLTARGNTDETKAEVKQFRAEVRFLRALSYWHGLDMFGNIPIVPESNPVGTSSPNQPENGKLDVFALIESELKDVEADMGDPGTVEYGRADKAALWMLLAKLYQNAKVYTGTAKDTESLTYLNKIIQSGIYSLATDYQDNFLADNNKSPEIIFAVNFDGTHTQTYGGMTFLCHASVGGSMVAANYGLDGGWAGLRATKNLVNLFPDETGATDSRAIFYTAGQSKEIPSTPITSFNEGYAVPKFVNLTSDGESGSNSTFVDNDYPMFRLADVYLMYAEAVVRGGSGGDQSTAVGYINQLRQRAYGDATGNISAANLTLDFLIDERGRELYWEGHRRTDLVRFGLFTTSDSGNPRAIWPWKGNVPEGKETEAFRDVFPIPASAKIANPSLEQNSGY